MDVTALADPVGEIVRDAADRFVRPRFRALLDGDVDEKSPGELVTVADREAEAAITAALRRVAPGVPVVGEEAAAADPSVADAMTRAPHCWLVDPLDGTGCFVDGSADHAVMVALLRSAEPVGAWVWQPEHGVMWTAERGGGTRRDGTEVGRGSARDVSEMTAAVLTRFADDRTRAAVTAAADAFARVVEAPRCAGVVYPAVVEGRYDAALFWRTLPWDHAAGTLLVTEAGGAARRPDATPYRVGDGRAGLLATRVATAWGPVREALLGGY